jgi:hypothetical protein
MWLIILKFVAKYGKSAVDWALKNKWKLLALANTAWSYILSV